MSISLKKKYHYICIPVRTILFLIIFCTPDTYMKYWLIPAILSLIILLYRYSTFNKNQKGAFNQPVRWQQMRIFHLTTLSIFIIFILYKKYKLAKIIPLLDILSVFFYKPTE